MLIWTLTFFSVLVTAALLGGAASWEGIFLGVRVGFFALVALVLLAQARRMIRRMAGSWEDAASRQCPSNRGPYRDIRLDRVHAAGKRERSARAA